MKKIISPASPAPSAVDADQSRNLEEILPEKQDWILSDLVNMVNAFDFELGITLTIGGSLLSGTLIGAKKYHLEMINYISGNTIEKDGPNDKSNVLTDYYEQTLSLYPEMDPKNLFNEKINYLHLKDARIVLGGSTIVPSKGGVLWRGRIARVDGFFLGVMSSE